MHEIMVVKANGEKAPFSEEKVRESMTRARTPQGTQKKALAHLIPQLYDGISTKEIYDILFDYLRGTDKVAAAKYSLKNAIMALGPSGFPFEQFVARIYTALGYKTTTNVTLEGKCISHEIDVVVEKEGEKVMIESKFHNRHGVKTDVKVALYIKSRFEDLKEKHGFTGACVATNTKLTSDALRYAKCAGLDVLSWDDPPGRSLPVLVEEAKLHPVTECTDLSNSDKARLLDAGIVLCNDLAQSNVDRLAQKTDINAKKLQKAQAEVTGILANHVHT